MHVHTLTQPHRPQKKTVDGQAFMSILVQWLLLSVLCTEQWR